MKLELPDNYDHILLDVDGVLADFCGGVADLFDVDVSRLTRWGLWDDIGCTREEFDQRMSACGREWWGNLRPYPWAHELFDCCRQIAPVTLFTTPWDSVGCCDGKKDWIRTHLGDVPTLFGGNKWLASRLGRALIDDNNINCQKFNMWGGTAYLFPRPWNNHAQWAGDPWGWLREQLISDRVCWN